MATTYRFKVLTPGKNVFDADVVSIVAPGESGYLGVLAGHAPLISTLVPGELKVKMEGRSEQRFRVEGGILRVARNSVVLLSERVDKIPDDA